MLTKVLGVINLPLPSNDKLRSSSTGWEEAPLAEVLVDSLLLPPRLMAGVRLTVSRGTDAVSVTTG